MQLIVYYVVFMIAGDIAAYLIGLVVERFLFRRFYREDPALGLLLTFGLAMVAEQALRESEERLQALSRRLLEVQEAERRERRRGGAGDGEVTGVRALHAVEDLEE